MKRVWMMCLILVLAWALPVWADEVDEELGFLDIKGSTGFTLGYWDLDLSALDAQIKDTYPELGNGMIMYGFPSYMGFEEGLRWGSTWFVGIKTESEDNAVSQLTTTVGGLDLSYGKVLTERIDVTAGGFIGAGTFSLILRKEALTTPEVPNKIYVSNIFFAFGPKITVDYSINDWCTVRGVGGYILGIGKKNWLDMDLRTDAIEPLAMKGALVGLDFSFVY